MSNDLPVGKKSTHRLVFNFETEPLTEQKPDPEALRLHSEIGACYVRDKYGGVIV